MFNRGRLTTALIAAIAAPLLMVRPAQAVQCGTGPGGFEAWKSAFADEAKAQGIGGAGVNALMATHYNYATIAADRGLKSFRLSLPAFMAKRGASIIAARGRKVKQSYADLFASIEARYGVPPGPLIAIWGMESAFGHEHGNQQSLSAIATLAYDCRRPDFFTDQLLAALKLVDDGRMSTETRGSMHGEIGQTQFLPKTMLQYGVGNLDTAEGALASTANYLKAHGWQRGAGYQPGEPNYAAIQAWNAASVYEQTIAIVGKEIDGGDD